MKDSKVSNEMIIVRIWWRELSCVKKYKLCTCMNVCVKPVQNGKNISFCISVLDKNTNDLATYILHYIHLSIWLFKAHTTQY